MMVEFTPDAKSVPRPLSIDFHVKQSRSTNAGYNLQCCPCYRPAVVRQ